jgi:hypothetical protein
MLVHKKPSCNAGTDGVPGTYHGPRVGLLLAMVKRIVVVVLILAAFVYAADAIVEKMTGEGIFMRLGY